MAGTPWPPDPERVLTPKAAGALGVAAVLGLLAGCENSASVSQADLDPAAVIRQAAERSSAASFGFTMEQTLFGEQFVAEGEYQGGTVVAMQFRSHDGEFAMISIGSDTYTQFADGGDLFPSGTWSKSREGEDEVSQMDPRQYFGALLAAGSVDELGPADVEGVPTRQYVGAITVADLQAATVDEAIRESLLDNLKREKDGSAHIRAWIDENFQIRRFQMEGEQKADDFNSAGYYAFTATLRDFGRDFRITAPPASEVVDADAGPGGRPAEFAPEGNFGDAKCQKAMERQLTRYNENPEQSPAGSNLPKACR